MVNSSIEVNKIPLESKPRERPQVFPRMPLLYLELLENKSKVKQDCINTEYVHKYSSDETDSPPELVREEYDDESVDSRDDSVYSDGESDDQETSSNIENYDKNRSELFENVGEDISDDEMSVEQGEEMSVVTSNSTASHGSDGSGYSETVTSKLNELIEDSDDEIPIKTKHAKKDKSKYSVRRDKSGHSVSKRNKPPTLAELAAAGSFVPKSELRDINNIPTKDKHYDDMKRELLFKFELLKKSYPGASIPEYTIHTDYNTMINSYEDCVRRLSLDSSVENYKQYLIYGFMGIEFLFGKFLKLDMEGFTQQQILSMSSYEKLLIELGEKSYVPEGSNWSVELRLLFLVIMNSAFFIVSKMIMKKTSIDLMNMMNGMSMSMPTSTSKEDSDSKPKRKMKGPELDLDDL